MISIRINLDKVNKDRIYYGEKGKYLDCILIETPNNQYGDYMIKQSIPKEERDAGIEGNILGNGKTLLKREQYPDSHNEPEDLNTGEIDSDLGF